MPEDQGGRHSLHPEEPPQQPVDKHEARPHRSNYDELAASTADPNLWVLSMITTCLQITWMMIFSSLPRKQDPNALWIWRIKWKKLYMYMQRTDKLLVTVQDYELLEASLWFRLVERFGKKPLVKAQKNLLLEK